MNKNETCLCQVCSAEFEINLIELSRSRPPIMCEKCIVEHAIKIKDWYPEMLEYLKSKKK